MGRIFLAAILGFLFDSLFASSQPASSSPSAQPPPAGEVRFEPYAVVSRWGPPVVRAELGRFSVPENRSSGSSRAIELAFVRLKSTAKRPGAPIVWLAGGPGRSGIDDLETPLLALLLDLRRHGDVLVLDQRGTGRSVPRLDCPGTITFRKDVPLDHDLVAGALEASATQCGAYWRSRGVDLAGYNTGESAEDVDDLRRAVGAPTLRILAGSYGTHLAIAVLRAHGDRIERAALTGVVGPDHLRRMPSDINEQLEAIAALVRDDRLFARTMPDFLATLREVRERLAARPITVRVRTGEGFENVTVGHFDLALFTRSLLTSRSSIALLPGLFADMAAGDFSELGATALAWRTSLLPKASMYLMRCASGASAARDKRIAADHGAAILGEGADLADERMCRAWGTPRLPDAFREPVFSSVPTLFVTGSLDGKSPESNAREVSAGFRRASLLKIEGAAHSLLGFEGEDERGAISEFLSGHELKKTIVRLPALALAPPGSNVTILAERSGGRAALFGGAP